VVVLVRKILSLCRQVYTNAVISMYDEYSSKLLQPCLVCLGFLHPGIMVLLCEIGEESLHAVWMNDEIIQFAGVKTSCVTVLCCVYLRQIMQSVNQFAK
jgi:hypothetical protein